MSAALSTAADPLDGLTLLERGWLSSNNLIIHPARGEPGAVLVDASHTRHQAQTLALLQRVLGRPAGGGAVEGVGTGAGAGAGSVAPPADPDATPLALVVNTHLHSDHCGGNAAVSAAFGAPVAIPPGQVAAVAAWDDTLSHVTTGQRATRFTVDRVLPPGQPLVAGGREWQVLAAPGHDPDSVMLFDARHGVLVSADALWENGFGVVFPEVLGGEGFDDVGQVLDTIAALPVRLVVPGHGRAFDDVAESLQRARARLAAFQRQPERHARYAVKVMIKYHLMEEGEQALPALLDWAEGVPLLQQVWDAFRPSGHHDRRAWWVHLLEELAAGGAIRRDGERVIDQG